jgi:hypothetical protein
MENGLVGYWHFDEGVGTTTLDASGNGNNGVFGGSPVWQLNANCKVSGCLNFDGINSYISIPATINDSLNTEATLVMWMKLANNIHAGYKTGFVRFGNDATGLSHYPWTDGLIYLSTFRAARWNSINDGGFDKTQWHMITITSAPGAGNYRLYQNDKLVASTTGDAVIAKSAAPNIGMSTGGYSLNGFVDEVRIYNRALSAIEIKTIYEDLK